MEGVLQLARNFAIMDGAGKSSTGAPSILYLSLFIFLYIFKFPWCNFLDASQYSAHGREG